MSYAETETPASKVLYINSDNATTRYNDQDTNFEFVLEEPIVVPPHHSILASVYSVEIPYSFYNFEAGRNTLLDYQVTTAGTKANYVDVSGKAVFDYTPSGGCYRVYIPEGNYTAVNLANTLKSLILTSPAGVPALDVVYDPVKQKFKFACIVKNIRVTLGLAHGLFSGKDGDDINEEIGFDLNKIQGDPFFEYFPSGPTPYNNGYTNPPPVLPGAGIDINKGPYVIQTYLYADDVADMNSSIRSLFIRTNLTSQSVLDSFIGGGFSNIFCKIPLNADPGGTLRVEPANGDVHKVLLRTKVITAVQITLTNQRNKVIDLNGLNFDISIKLDFVETKDLPTAPNLRLQYQNLQSEGSLRQAEQQKQQPPEKLKEKKTTKSKK